MRRIVAVVLLATLVAACGSSDAGPRFADDATATAADYSYTIPPGAGEALDRGEPLDILPAVLTVHVGEVIELINHDDRGHLVGPFFVGAGETLRQRFSRAGEFVGECTVHPSGQIRLIVEEA
jgi:plastocyanin